jgi:hypothetical protein
MGMGAKTVRVSGRIEVPKGHAERQAFGLDAIAMENERLKAFAREMLECRGWKSWPGDVLAV